MAPEPTQAHTGSQRPHAASATQSFVPPSSCDHISPSPRHTHRLAHEENRVHTAGAAHTSL